MIDELGRLELLKNELTFGMGPSVFNKAVTSKLYVSPNGSGLDGSTIKKAFTTIQEALTAASSNANDLTLILISPHTAYDIDTAGDPTYSGNYILKGSHRFWSLIKNDHASATAIMKFTGLISLEDLNFNLGTGNNGVIITKSGFRVRRAIFDGTSLTGAANALHIDGATTIKHGRIEDIDFAGHVTHMRGLLLDNASRNHIDNVHLHECLEAIQIVNAASDENHFNDVDIGNCALGLNLDAGNEQHFDTIKFHQNTMNVDDEVGDHDWNNIIGQLSVNVEPDNFTGVTINTHANPDTWGTDTEIRSAVAATKPFKIVATIAEASAAEKFRIRFSDDSGSTHFDDIFIEGEVNAIKREVQVADTNTDHIFNKGTKISASAKSESGNNSTVVWLEIQEI